jgi:N-6 DNA Methylase
MARVRNSRASALAFDAITVEGALISPAMLARIARHDADQQKEPDYFIPKGLTLRDEIARYFRIGQALYAELTASKTPSPAATLSFVEKLLRDTFGFSDLRRVGSRTLGDRQFAITLDGLGGRVPVVVVPPTDELDRPSTHLAGDGHRRSAASAVQDWLNASGDIAWGLCSNGSVLRLVRDNASLTRPAFIEANLRRIFEDEAFADFTALWLLIHASRFGQPGSPPSDCALERWREAGQKEGIAARDNLRDGVEAALLSLGTGFLSHTENAALRERLSAGAMPLPEFFGQLLRLVYRLIFLLAAEDRNLLHAPNATAVGRKLYAEGYSVGSLRDRAVRRAAWDRHHDRWEGLLITFAALGRGEPRLGLPALDGLFARGPIPDLETAKLANRSLMEAIYRLAWLKGDSGLVPVNWRDMETEELGSVYESLLELTPRINGDGRRFLFAEGGEAKGHARKTSGSYYTPDSLVQALLDSALDPVLDRVEAEANDPAAALLSVSVLDPACGSGHFLLAAARRIAARLARARAGGVAAPADFRHALRDVARACIHGVDRNPMAVELTKVALWIETVDPGKPLGFLDANIRCGDSLLGVFELKEMVQGIPDAAYKPLAGDDKDAAKIAGRINREQRESAAQHDLALVQGAAALARAARAVATMPEEDLADVEARARAYEAVHAEGGWWATKTACDLCVAAFLAPKHFRSGALARAQTPDCVPTTLDVLTALAGRQPDAQLVAKAVELAGAARVFHWPLEFPAIMTAGGFDVVLGNPPWERIKLQEQEFFAAREPEIAQAPNAAARGRLIARLKEAAPGTRERALYNEFEAAKRAAEASSVFARLASDEGGRFPLTGRGDVNTYALFAELFTKLASKRGRSGVIVPTGIATDATTAPFFAALIGANQLAQLVDFENRERIFPAIDSRIKFSLLTTGREVKQADFAFFLTDAHQLSEPERRFALSADDIALINPNTRNCPIFRSKADAELTKAIYRRVPIFGRSRAEGGWEPEFFKKMFDFDIHTALLNFSLERPSDDYLPLYEAKMIGHFNHRFSTYEGVSAKDIENGKAREAESAELENPDWEITPRCWTHRTNFSARMENRNWNASWFLSMRDVTNATNERTAIFAVRPYLPANDKLPSVFVRYPARDVACLVANLSSFAFDYIARQKVGGTNFGSYLVEQLPVLPPSSYTPEGTDFIVPRVLELTYTSRSMAPFARDLGYDGPPFAWDEGCRAQLRAELDAWYAHAYGLTRDELRYILDPADVMGADYPSETFRVLKTNEIRHFGEYRTARLVLQAWDALERREIPEISPTTVVTTPAEAPIIVPVDPEKLPDGTWAASGTGQDAMLAQLAALIKALPAPTAIPRVRLAGLFALEPRYFTRRLSGAERATWRRLVGASAEVLDGTNITALAPKINASWGSAVAQLRGMGALVEDAAAQTWAAGPKIGEFQIDPKDWTLGRAAFVLKAMQGLTFDDAVADLATEDQVWMRTHAA